MEVMELPAFRMRALEPESIEKQLDDRDATIGEATLVIACMGIPDTGRPVGVRSRQVIDRGAFRRVAGTEAKRPYFLDHGDAHVRGYIDSFKLMGTVGEFSEVDDELKVRGVYDLRLDAGRIGFQQLVGPTRDVIHASFRWPPDEVVMRAGDGFEHVTEFSDVIEVSQLPIASQMMTRVEPGSIVARAMSMTAEWDGNAAMAKASTAAEYRLIAFERTVGQPDEAQHWALPHHATPGGPAVLGGVRAALQRLPQTQNLKSPEAAKSHLNDHMAEARNAARGAWEEIRVLITEDEDFAAELAVPEEVLGDGLRHPSLKQVRTFLLDPKWRQLVSSELRKDDESKEALSQLVADANADDPVTAFYKHLWEGRQPASATA